MHGLVSIARLNPLKVGPIPSPGRWV